MLWIFALPVATACPQPTALRDLYPETETSSSLFGEARVDELHQLTERSRAALPCLAEPLTLEAARSWRQLEALDAFTRMDDAGTVRALRAALWIDPGFTLPDSLRSNGFLEASVEQAKGAPPPRVEAVDVPSRYELIVDGRVTDQVPRDWTPVLQARDPKGQILWTTLPAPGEPLKLEFPRRHGALLAAAGVSGAAAAGLGVWALRTVDAPPDHATLAALDSEARAAELEAWQRRVYGLDAGAILAAGSAVALGTLWATVRW